MASFRTVKGFRDLFPEDCARRNYIFDTWRHVARRYGFVEYEGPVVESTDLYRKKSGDEITTQLFCFEDKAGREIALRPEVTPSLARMATARQRDFKKPMKWFQIGSCFRYEEPQEGRSREFVQFNADILGDNSPGADAEIVALAIDVMLAFGLKEGDFAIRLSNREIWNQFLASRSGFDPADTGRFLQIIDKIERAPAAETAAKLETFGMSLEEVRTFMTGADAEHPALAALRRDLEARGLWQFVRVDASIVRGLAYYTGTVFEVFDLRHDLRAVAGGGRYDGLCYLMSDGAVDLPSAGFAMGDVVLGILLAKSPGAQMRLTDYMLRQFGAEVYVVVADEARRAEALRGVQTLRDSGIRTEYSISAQKVGKQFQQAEAQRARLAVVVGGEYPEIVIKNLISREQTSVPVAALAERVRAMLAEPELGPLLA